MKKVVVLFSVMLFFSGMATGGTYEKKALLIGVGQYKNADDEGLKNLNGPKNDVKLIKEEFLKPVLGYTEDQIDVLVDSDATRKNIVNKMNAFIKGKNVKERFFYFSGHGGQTDDISGDEEYDALDEVILPHDAAYKSDGSWDDRTIISDDDIRQWFEKLSGKKLTAMFDSCHSGTVCRSMGNLQGVPVSTPKHAFSKMRKNCQKEKKYRKVMFIFTRPWTRRQHWKGKTVTIPLQASILRHSSGLSGISPDKNKIRKRSLI